MRLIMKINFISVLSHIVTVSFTMILFFYFSATVYAQGESSAISTNYIAHRGLNKKAPENTEAAFKLAGEAGYWGIETDVYEAKHDGKCSDKDLVLSHDDTLKRMCGVNKKVRSLTSAKLCSIKVTKGPNAKKYNQKICLFETYLKICAKYNAHPVVELKDQKISVSATHKVIDMLYKYELLDKSEINSFYPLLTKRAIDYSASAYNIEPSSQYTVSHPDSDTALQEAEEAVFLGFNGIGVNYKYMTPEIYKYCTEHNLRLDLWVLSASDKKQINRYIKRYSPQTITVNG